MPRYLLLLAIDVHTGSATVALREYVYDELARRLAQFGAPDAAERLLAVGPFGTRTNPWFAKFSPDGDDQPGTLNGDSELAELHGRLGRDLNRNWQND